MKGGERGRPRDEAAGPTWYVQLAHLRWGRTVSGTRVLAEAKGAFDRSAQARVGRCLDALSRRHPLGVAFLDRHHWADLEVSIPGGMAYR